MRRVNLPILEKVYQEAGDHLPLLPLPSAGWPVDGVR